MSDRINEIEEMTQFELLDLIEQIRDIVWNGEDAREVVFDLRELVGAPEDWEDDNEFSDED